MLKYDTIHGCNKGHVTFQNGNFTTRLALFVKKDAAAINWASTGVFTTNRKVSINEFKILFYQWFGMDAVPLLKRAFAYFEGKGGEIGRAHV